MADDTPPGESDAHRYAFLEASRKRSQTLRGIELQPLGDQISPTTSEDRRSDPVQLPEISPAQPQENTRETDDNEEQVTLLPREDGRPSPSGNSHSSPEATDKVDSTSSVALHKSRYILLMVFTYAAAALTAWILTCVLTVKPLTTGYYGYDTRSKESTDELHVKLVRNDKLYRAARTIQTIVAVLTIPLTSAVCSAAAVVFVQTKTRQRNLTMRQMMTLADKG